MDRTEFLPTTQWSDHISAYWLLTAGPKPEMQGQRIYSDRCADLICNTGTSPAYFHTMSDGRQMISLTPGRLYLGGTMTAYGILKCDPGCVLTGIRFWPELKKLKRIACREKPNSSISAYSLVRKRLYNLF